MTDKWSIVLGFFDSFLENCVLKRQVRAKDTQANVLSKAIELYTNIKLKAFWTYAASIKVGSADKVQIKS